MVKKEISIERLNTRDRLLLSQILEQHGLKNIESIHEEFTTHPAFRLSHNKLNGDELHVTQRQLKQLIDELLAEHKDLDIIQLCEHYYSKRLEELNEQIATTQAEFTETAAQAKSS